ncbi:MAG: glycerophosphodiester phosphodiesterase [Myxococcota bacterium]
MRPLNIAHRGASAEAPENTRAAFQLALEHGADMIETDLHPTRDGHIVLHHDFLCEGRPIATLSLAEIRHRRPDTLTLEDVLDALGASVPFNLELKCPPGGRYEGLEKRVLHLVRARGLLARTLFSCFTQAVLAALREHAADARLGLLVTSPQDLVGRAHRVRAESVHLPLWLAGRARIEELQRHGLKVHVFTVDAEPDQRRLLEWGVDGLFTNDPRRLRHLLRSRS